MNQSQAGSILNLEGIAQQSPGLLLLSNPGKTHEKIYQPQRGCVGFLQSAQRQLNSRALKSEWSKKYPRNTSAANSNVSPVV
jgi:hypothetical protein